MCCVERIANQLVVKMVLFQTVLTELISRILDLEAEDWEVDDGMMVVTIFQFSSYFLSQGRYVIDYNPTLLYPLSTQQGNLEMST